MERRPIRSRLARLGAGGWNRSLATQLAAVLLFSAVVWTTAADVSRAAGAGRLVDNQAAFMHARPFLTPAEGPLSTLTGAFDLTHDFVSALRLERCFGAAARGPGSSDCSAQELGLTVTPTPAELTRDYVGTLLIQPCPQKEGEGLLRGCASGTSPAEATRHIALVGDSHAGRWQQGFTMVAGRLGWHVDHFAKLGCPFSALTRPIAGLSTDECVEWKRQLRAWLAARPEIDTLFVAQLSQPYRGQKRLEDDIAGYQRQWRTLPKSIKQIVVLRDNPRSGRETLRCISRALAVHKSPGASCALPRKRVLEAYPDAAAAAARRMASPRVGVVDLTNIYCNSSVCYPVIGGVMVTSDKSHLTPLFLGTLMPYVLQALQRGKWLGQVSNPYL